MDTKNLNKRKLEDEIEIDAEKLKKSEFYKQQGNELYKKLMFDEALDYYFKAITLNPTDYRCYGNIGQILINKSLYPEAKEVLNEAINLNSNYTKAYYRLGLVEKYMKNYDEAFRNFDKALKLEPNNKATIKELDEIKKLIEPNQINYSEISVPKSIRMINDTLENSSDSSKLVNHSKNSTKLTSNVKNTSITKSFKNLNLLEIDIPVELPTTLPKTSYEYNKFWREIKDVNMKIDYLRFVGANTFVELFRKNLEPDFFSEIIVLLTMVNDKNMVYSFLNSITKIDGFDFAIMFLSDKEKEMIKQLINSLNSILNPLIVNKLLSLYKV